MNSVPENREIPRNVGIWIRVSTEDQARGESPEHHERRARSYAESKGWAVTEVYHLEGVSGKLVSRHPETVRMLADIRQGHISALIFSKLARLARNTKELLEFADIFRQCSADLVYLQESIDTSTPAGRLFYTMLAAMAQWEREEIVERVKASVPVRTQLGKQLGGAAPYGFQWQDKKLVVHPKEGPVRKLIYELFLELRRKKAVATHLNKAGYRTRKGSKFCGTTVGRLIQDTTAKGLHRTNYSRRAYDDRAWEFKPASDWVMTPVESLVSEELWERCNDILAETSEIVNRPGKRTVHLFSGLVFCGCGEKMYVPANSPKYTCTACRTKIPEASLEEIFLEQLHSFLVSPTEVEAYLHNADEALVEKERLLQIRMKEVEQVRREAEKTYRLYQADQIKTESFATFYKPIEERREQLEDEIPRLQGEIDVLKANALSSRQVMVDAHDLQSRWPHLEHDEKRKIVECITNRITISQEEIVIDLCYLP